MADRTVSVNLMARVQGYVAGIGTSIKATKQLSGELDRLGHESPKQLGDVAEAVGGVGLALVGVAGYAVKMAADFDKQMSEVNAVSGASKGELEQLRQAALDAGAATKYSATEAAKAEAELAKAGMSTADILGGALKGSLALAAAGSIDLAEAADIAAKTMNVFQLEGKDVGHIADLLAAAANKSATDVHEMGEALRMGGLAANGAGISLEETVGTLAAFADRALVGSDAGTSLKTALMMIQAPTEKSASLMQELGIKAYDANGNFIGMAKLAGVLKTALGGLTQEQRNAALATIFGADAMRAANVLFELGEQGVKDYVAAVDDQGAAADVAAKKTDNLAGDIERLKGSIETLAIEAGSGANGGMRALVEVLQRVVDIFAALPGGVQSGAVVLAGLGGAALLATAGFLKVKQVGGEALEALSGMGPAGDKAAKGIEKAGVATAKFAAAAAAAVIAAQLIGVAWESFVDQPKDTKLDELSKGLIEFGKTGKAGAGTADLFGKSLERLDRDLTSLNNNKPDNAMHRWSKFIEGIAGTDADGTFTRARMNIAQIDEALAQLQSSGHTAEAAAAFEKLAQHAAKGGVNINELRAGLPQYQAALDGATQSQQNSIAAFEASKNKATALAGGWREAVDAGKTLKDLFDSLNGAATGYAEAEISAEAAVDKLTEALRESAGSLDVNTSKGRDAKTALLGLAEAAGIAAQKKYEETGSLEQAKGVYDTYIAKLRAAMIAAGLNAGEVDRLIGLYASMPALVQTVVREIRERIIRTKIETPQNGNYWDQPARLGGKADGGIVHFAGGGIHEQHLAEIAAPGDMRLWAEPETGGEAYIPLATAKRQRSTQLLSEVNRRFGNPLGGEIQAVQVNGRIVIEGTGVLSGIRKEVLIRGGDVQQVLGK